MNGINTIVQAKKHKLKDEFKKATVLKEGIENSYFGFMEFYRKKSAYLEDDVKRKLEESIDEFRERLSKFKIFYLEAEKHYNLVAPVFDLYEKIKNEKEDIAEQCAEVKQIIAYVGKLQKEISGYKEEQDNWQANVIKRISAAEEMARKALSETSSLKTELGESNFKSEKRFELINSNLGMVGEAIKKISDSNLVAKMEKESVEREKVLSELELRISKMEVSTINGVEIARIAQTVAPIESKEPSKATKALGSLFKTTIKVGVVGAMIYGAAYGTFIVKDNVGQFIGRRIDAVSVLWDAVKHRPNKVPEIAMEAPPAPVYVPPVQTTLDPALEKAKNEMKPGGELIQIAGLMPQIRYPKYTDYFDEVDNKRIETFMNDENYDYVDVKIRTVYESCTSATALMNALLQRNPDIKIETSALIHRISDPFRTWKKGRNEHQKGLSPDYIVSELDNIPTNDDAQPDEM